MQKPVAIQAPSRGRVVGAWIVQGLLAAAFLAAGGAKLAGVPMMVQIFDQIGMGQWFRIVTGLVEVIGAVALVVPGLDPKSTRLNSSHLVISYAVFCLKKKKGRLLIYSVYDV